MAMTLHACLCTSIQQTNVPLSVFVKGTVFLILYIMLVSLNSLEKITKISF